MDRTRGKKVGIENTEGGVSGRSWASDRLPSRTCRNRLQIEVGQLYCYEQAPLRKMIWSGARQLHASARHKAIVATAIFSLQ